MTSVEEPVTVERERLTVAMPPKLRRDLEAVARQEDQSLAQLLRRGARLVVAEARKETAAA